MTPYTREDLWSYFILMKNSLPRAISTFVPSSYFIQEYKHLASPLLFRSSLSRLPWKSQCILNLVNDISMSSLALGKARSCKEPNLVFVCGDGDSKRGRVDNLLWCKILPNSAQDVKNLLAHPLGMQWLLSHISLLTE